MDIVLWICLILMFNPFSTVTHGLQINGAHQVKATTPSYKGFRLKDCVFQIIHGKSSMDCAQHCLANELCKTINYRPTSCNIRSTCELNNCTKVDHPADKFIKDPEFTYYELKEQRTVEPLSVNTIRLPTAPKNCSDFLPGRHPSANYSIYDDNGDTFTVWCHLDHAQGKAWTLVTSVSFANLGETSLTKTQLILNAPVNDNSPNLNRYRMSLARMQQIRNMSTYWYAVCNFNGTISDRRDTARGNFSEFDPMTYIGSRKCKEVEYINIRGFTCKQCTALWYHSKGYMLHVDSSKAEKCGLDATTGAISKEDNFGFYRDVNNDFTCTKNSASTTSWWFGH